MAPLTEEQRERIRINRERALEIKRRKKEEREQQQQQQTSTVNDTKNGDDSASSVSGKRKADRGGELYSTNEHAGGADKSSPLKKSKNAPNGGVKFVTTEAAAAALPSFLDDGLPIETFEEGGSEWVTKKEAMSTYCLSEGTLAVMKIVEERDNPHNKLWKPMRLYRRTEVREWAHKRWDGLDNLQQERDRRQERKLEKDMKDAGDIFK